MDTKGCAKGCGEHSLVRLVMDSGSDFKTRPQNTQSLKVWVVIKDQEVSQDKLL